MKIKTEKQRSFPCVVCGELTDKTIFIKYENRYVCSDCSNKIFFKEASYHHDRVNVTLGLEE